MKYRYLIFADEHLILPDCILLIGHGKSVERWPEEKSVYLPTANHGELQKQTFSRHVHGYQVVLFPVSTLHFHGM